MAACEKVYVCGRCEDFGAPTLEELVSHMTNCDYPEIQKKDDTNQSEESTLALFEESENSEGAIEIEKESSQKGKLLEGTVENLQSGYSSHIIDVGRTSPTPFIWNKKTALLLLKLVKNHKADMESPYIRRKTVWQKIAVEMQENYGYNVSPSQCENKFKNMSNRYRKARDYNQRPKDGRMKETCFLYNELDEYYQSDERYQSRNELMFDSRAKPNIVRHSIYVGPELDYIAKEPEIVIAEEESAKQENNSENKTEPVWLKKALETFEKCHRESMQMQREFINVLKQILDKK